MATDDEKKYFTKEMSNDDRLSQLYQICFKIISRMLVKSNVCIDFPVEEFEKPEPKIGIQLDNGGKNFLFVPVNSIDRVKIPFDKVKFSSLRLDPETESLSHYDGWIKIAKSLPPEEQIVLVTADFPNGCHPMAAAFKMVDGNPKFYMNAMINDSWVALHVPNVTHWMHIPEPPANKVPIRSMNNDPEPVVQKEKPYMPFTHNRKSKKKKKRRK